MDDGQEQRHPTQRDGHHEITTAGCRLESSYAKIFCSLNHRPHAWNGVDTGLHDEKKEDTMNIQTLMMVFPVVFMFHDFEELCFLESWIRKNADFLRNTFAGKNWLGLEGYSTSALGIAIMMMFLFVSFTSILSVVFNLYALFAAAMIVFTLHNLVHIIQPVLLRRYVPAMGSAILTIPYSFYVLHFMNRLHLFIWRDTIIFSMLFGVLTFTYLGVAKRIGFWIDKRFNRY